ncbi:hypothetical protein BT63DRAFT_270883 [Microthyrium microscopicum]|uniref:Uncharacterized protein n=1 Tax=Microthyrium microscopicum TaxID=703497 RepID=A0A6A6U7S4_9PEZI|nr:hypothetical protein BT63DRAFT_270883 [Microthyrium microscopicum]
MALFKMEILGRVMPTRTPLAVPSAALSAVCSQRQTSDIYSRAMLPGRAFLFPNLAGFFCELALIMSLWFQLLTNINSSSASSVAGAAATALFCTASLPDTKSSSHHFQPRLLIHVYKISGWLLDV